MEEFSQEYILSIVFKNSIDREELLYKKLEDYCDEVKNKELRELLKLMKTASQEHVKLMKDKMIKLKIQG